MTALTNERLLAGRLGLRGFAPQLDPDWNSWMDQNLLRLSVLSQLTVIGRDISLPDDPPDGSVYIVPADASGNANEVAARDNGAYTFFEPWPGLLAWISSENLFVFYDGASESWQNLLAAGDSSSFTGLSDTPADLSSAPGQRVVVAEDGGGLALEPVAYDIPLFVGGLLEANGGIRFLTARTFSLPVNMAGSLAMLQVPADANLDIQIRRNGMDVSTLNFASGVLGGTFSGPAAPVLFNSGDLIEIVFPDPQNATASGLSVTLAGMQ